MTVIGRLTALLGSEAVDTAADIPVARPWSTETAAAVLRVAHEVGWQVRIQGNGSWMPADAPADLALSTAGLVRVIDLVPNDLVVTVEAGIPCSTLDAALAEHGVWLPFDAPGDARRTVGSIIATGTAGPLRLTFGAVKDQILGLVAVTGEGRVVRAGGRVVKNVAGYDLSRLLAGSFGAFGVAAHLHLRLRALPRADSTWLATGPRDDLFDAAAELEASDCRPSALEIISPEAAGAADWALAVRSLGSPAAVEADAALIRSIVPGASEIGGPDAGDLWREIRRRAGEHPVTIRAGALPEGVESIVEEIEHALGPGWLSAGPTHGALRWSGDPDPATLILLRRRLAAREVPVTLERAPWPVRAQVGHFGAYREGVGPLVSELRRVFDPGGRLVVPLEVA